MNLYIDQHSFGDKKESGKLQANTVKTCQQFMST